MEIKYGRSYKLSNGEHEYIEVSCSITHSTEIDNRMNSLKHKVEEIHYKTEEEIDYWKNCFKTKEEKESI